MKHFIIIILCVIILCGCEKEEVSEQITPTEYTEISNIFSSDRISFEYDFMFIRENHMNNIFTIDDQIYVTAERVIYGNDDDYYVQLYLLTYDSNGNMIKSFNIVPTDEDSTVVFMRYDSNYDSITIEELNYYYTLYKKTSDGTVIFSKPIDINNIFSMVIGENDSIYIAGKNKVIIYSNDGELICSIDISNQLANISSAHGKKPILKLSGNGNKAIYKYINIETKSLDDIEMPVSETVYIDESNILYGKGFDYYFYDKDCLYGYNIKNNVTVKVLDWIQSDINTKLIKSFCILSPEKMAMVANESDKSYLFILNSVPEDEVEVKKTITLGWISAYDNQYLNEVITYFNKNNSKYRIVPINYYSEDYGDNSYQKLNLEIAAGNEPDLLYVNGSIPMLNYINKDMFVDLNAYIDSEPELKNDLLPFVLENPKINNKLPQLITSFIAQTLVTKSKNIKNGEYLSIKKLSEIYRTLPNDVLLLNNSSREYIKSFYIYNTIPECVDYDNGACNFNTREMRYFLELVKILSGSNSNTSIFESYDKAKDDEVYFIDSLIYNYTFYLSCVKRPFMPEDSNTVGYPTGAGSKRGDYISSNGFSIFNTSKDKGAAWEFIKGCLSEDFYKRHLNSKVTLTTRSGVRYQVTSNTRDRKYTYLQIIGVGIGGYVTTNDNAINFEEKYGRGVLYNTEDLVNEYMSYIETINNFVYYDDTITNIINEELSTYLGSDKSIDSTIKAIQSRVSLYMSETWS